MFCFRLPPVIFAHFVDGLPESTPLGSYDFVYKGEEYKVSGVVQYKTNPNHFVAWIHDYKGKAI